MVEQGATPVYDTDIYSVGTIGGEPIGKINPFNIASDDLDNNDCLLDNLADIGDLGINTLWCAEKEKS